MTLHKINHLECRLYDDALNDLLKAMRGAGRKFDSALAELSKATAVAAAAGTGAAKPLSSDHSAIKLFLGFAED